MRQQRAGIRQFCVWAHRVSRWIRQSPKTRGGDDLAAEHGAVELYMPVSRRCEMLEDFVTKNIFEELLTDEDGHIDLLETQLDLVTKTG
jgi:bacterioferritin